MFSEYRLAVDAGSARTVSVSVAFGYLSLSTLKPATMTSHGGGFVKIPLELEAGADAGADNIDIDARYRCELDEFKLAA